MYESKGGEERIPPLKGGAGVGLYIGKMDRKWLSRVLIIMLADILGILGSYRGGNHYFPSAPPVYEHG